MIVFSLLNEITKEPQNPQHHRVVGGTFQCDRRASFKNRQAEDDEAFGTPNHSL